jgi:hypothetical protein
MPQQEETYSVAYWQCLEEAYDRQQEQSDVLASQSLRVGGRVAEEALANFRR